MEIHNHLAAKGVVAAALALGAAAVLGVTLGSARVPRPLAVVRVDAPDDRCAAMFKATADRAAARRHVHIERPVHDASSPDPDALVFPSPDGIEASAELVARAQWTLSALLDDQPPDRYGWVHAAYVADGFVVSLDERHEGASVVHVESFARDDSDRRWDAIATGLRDELQRAGDRCLSQR